MLAAVATAAAAAVVDDDVANAAAACAIPAGLPRPACAAIAQRVETCAPRRSARCEVAAATGQAREGARGGGGRRARRGEA
eukprot:COSAG04_NODE_2089_length_4822_cov_39.655939_3_plen_81_part_00